MDSGNTPMLPVTRVVFGLIAVNALAGALSLILLPGRTDDLFFWTVRPPLSAALFGALYLGGAAVVGWLTYRGEWEPARVLIPILVTAGVLITLTTLLHFDTFEGGVKRAYWLAVYVGAPFVALALYVLQERRGANWAVAAPVLPAVRNLAVAVGALLVVAGLVVIARPGLATSDWPWITGPLMVRIFASWFAAFGAGLLWFRVERDWARLRYVAYLMVAAAVLDLVLVAIHNADLSTTGVRFWLYCFHLGAFGLLGLAMLVLQERDAGQQRSLSLAGTPGPDAKAVSE